MDAGAGAATALRKRQLTVRTMSSNGGNGFRVGGGKGAAAATPPEPVSPSARLLEDFFIVVVIGIATPVNDPVARAGIAAQFARYPRFRSIQVDPCTCLAARGAPISSPLVLELTNGTSVCARACAGDG